MHIIDADERARHAGIWVLGEGAGPDLLPVSLELLGCARRLAQVRGQEVWAVLMGDDTSSWAVQAWEHGADVVLTVDDPTLARYVDEDQALILEGLIRLHRPEILLAGATSVGRALVPRVAVRCWSGLTADCTALDIDIESGALLQTRPAFGGSVMATIRSNDHLPQMATVRPGVMRPLERQVGHRGRLVQASMEDDQRSGLKEVIEVLAEASAGSFGDASFIIAGGRGMRGAEGFALLEQLAALVGGAVGATRAAVDNGWAPYGIQVGQTGRTVQPRVYLACGLSGQVQHLVGMQSSDLIIAINSDRHAPIMSAADFGVVGDVFAIVPALIRSLKTA